MKHTIPFLLAVCSLFTPILTQASQWGFCTDATSRNNIFRVGSTETQGMAIKLDSEKLAALKGRSITGISAVFGSQRTTGGNATLFLASDLDAPLYTQTVDVTGAIKWLDYSLSSPYTITGDEGQLYIGYTADISTKSSLLVADYTAPTKDCSFVYSDGEWIDAFSLAVGNVSLRIDLEDAADITDVMLKTLSDQGYYKAGQTYEFPMQIFNFGNTTVNQIDIATSVGDGTAVTATHTGLDIKQGSVADFTISVPMTEAEGYQSLKVEIKNVNGGNDADVSDNVFASALYFYPANMERSILLEGFTGQYCSNCPAGHNTVNQFLESTSSSVVEIYHHSGYSPDFMTMDADLDYTYFYGSPSTFAPAVMINRHCVPTVSATPVINVTAANLASVSAAVESLQPYVSLGLDSSFDPATREVNLKLNVYTHANLPATTNILNVMLAQNGIVGYQVPYGTDYEHNAVMRGVLTGNSWGVTLDDEAIISKGSQEWTTTFTLPEGIFADYYDWEKCTEAERILYTTPVEPENMYIVAYVASYDANDVNGHTIYNAVSAPLGRSYTQSGMAAIHDIDSEYFKEAEIRVQGRRVHVVGDYKDFSIYSLTGTSVDTDSELRPGVYVVRVVDQHGITARKIAVM